MITVKCPACGAPGVPVRNQRILSRHYNFFSSKSWCYGSECVLPPQPDDEGNYHVKPYEDQKRLAPHTRPRGICPVCKWDKTMTKSHVMAKHQRGTFGPRSSGESCSGSGQRSLGLPEGCI